MSSQTSCVVPGGAPSVGRSSGEVATEQPTQPPFQLPVEGGNSEKSPFSSFDDGTTAIPENLLQFLYTCSDDDEVTVNEDDMTFALSFDEKDLDVGSDELRRWKMENIGEGKGSVFALQASIMTAALQFKARKGRLTEDSNSGANQEDVSEIYNNTIAKFMAYTKE